MNTQQHTYQSSLALVGVSVPEHLEASAEVPVITGEPQTQGDIAVIPIGNAPKSGMEPVPTKGIQVVHGEATGNTHWLHAGFDSPGVAFKRVDKGLVVGIVDVPAGQTALLIHTDEHGSNGIGEGTYEIRRQREQAEEIRMVQD